MNEGISANEACQRQALSEEDFARMCNDDGSIKSQPQTTTFFLKDEPNASVTVNNTVLQLTLAAAVLLVVILLVAMVKKYQRKK